MSFDGLHLKRRANADFDSLTLWGGHAPHAVGMVSSLQHWRFLSLSLCTHLDLIDLRLLGA